MKEKKALKMTSQLVIFRAFLFISPPLPPPPPGLNYLIWFLEDKCNY